MRLVPVGRNGCPVVEEQELAVDDDAQEVLALTVRDRTCASTTPRPRSATFSGTSSGKVGDSGSPVRMPPTMTRRYAINNGLIFAIRLDSVRSDPSPSGVDRLDASTAGDTCHE